MIDLGYTPLSLAPRDAPRRCAHLVRIKGHLADKKQPLRIQYANALGPMVVQGGMRFLMGEGFLGVSLAGNTRGGPVKSIFEIEMYEPRLARPTR